MRAWFLWIALAAAMALGGCGKTQGELDTKPKPTLSGTEAKQEETKEAFRSDPQPEAASGKKRAEITETRQELRAVRKVLEEAERAADEAAKAIDLASPQAGKKEKADEP